MAAFTAPGWERTSYPATSPRPLVGRSRPVSILMVVVLPAPLGPRNPKISPRCTPNVTPSTAVKVPNRLVSSSTSMTGAPSRIAGPGGSAGSRAVGADPAGSAAPSRRRPHAGRRLVQQEHVREMDKRTGQAELLPHAAGEVPRQAVRRRSQAGDLQEGGPVFAESLFGHAAQFGKEAQVLVHGQVVVEVEPQAPRPG